MPETVGIVLNERESLKAETAQQLEKILSSKGITSFRYEIGSKIKETLYQKRPPILVLDYILGDYSTGLDVLEALQDIPEDERPITFFLTDEPSASVATAAMRAGARHFLDIGSPRALSELVEEIETTKRTTKTPPISEPHYEKMDDLIFESKSMQLLHAELQTESTQHTPLPLFYGESGVGKKTLAMAYAQSAGFSPLAITCLDLRYNLSDPNRVISPRRGSKGLLLMNVEADDGEFLEALAAQAAYLKKISSSYIVLGTTEDSQTADAWSKLIGGHVFQIPSLKDRSADISPFVQKFSREAAKILGIKCTPLSSKLIDTLTQKEWRNGLTQLREVILYAQQFQSQHDSDMSQVLEETYSRSAEYYTLKDLNASSPSRALIQGMLEKHRYRYRIVAAKLGISIADIHNILYEADAA